MAGELITQDFQIEWNGQLLGDDTSGLEIISFTPFAYPDVRTSDQNRPLDHGLFAGVDYYGSRTITLQMEVWGGWTAVRRVLAAFQIGVEAPLAWQLPDVGQLRANARVRRRDPLIVDQLYVVGATTTVSVEFLCTDPRLYGETKTSTATLSGSGGGMTFDATFNLIFGASTTPATLNIDNAGTFETRPVIRIDGPITNPSLGNETTGYTLSFNGELAAGEYLDVDFLNRTVVLNGTASRYVWIVDSAAWWSCPPGANTIRLGGSPGSPAPTMTVTWADAYV